MNSAAISHTTDSGSHKPLVDEIGGSSMHAGNRAQLPNVAQSGVAAAPGGIAWDVDQHGRRRVPPPSYSFQNRPGDATLGANSPAANLLSKVGLTSLASGGVVVLLLDIALTIGRLFIRSGIWIVSQLMQLTSSSNTSFSRQRGFLSGINRPMASSVPPSSNFPNMPQQTQTVPQQSPGAGTMLVGASVLSTLLRPVFNLLSPNTSKPSDVARFDENAVSHTKSLRPSTMSSLARVATAAMAAPAITTVTTKNLEILQDNILDAIKTLGNVLQSQIDQLHSSVTTTLSNQPSIASAPQQKSGMLSRLNLKEPTPTEYKTNNEEWGTYRATMGVVGGQNPNVSRRKRGFL